VTASESSAVLLLSHGSRDPRAEYVVDELVAAVAASAHVTVRAAHLDFTAPTPAVALRQLAAEGFTSVRLVPLLFTPGYHVTHDIPLAVQDSAVADRISVSVAPPLLGGGRPERDLLLTALADRLVQAGADQSVDALLLTSAGSSSLSARRRVVGLAKDLELAHGIPVVPAFASSGFCPSPIQALEALADRGVTNPAVASLFVAPGKLTDAVAAMCQALPVADPLGVSPAFVKLLVSQVQTLSKLTEPASTPRI
jgi:sirohydrochlorin ferrochelatase